MIRKDSVLVRSCSVKIIEILVTSIGGIVLSCVFVYIAVSAPKKAVLDCSLAEISPDFTIEQRQACRKARSESLTTTAN